MDQALVNRHHGPRPFAIWTLSAEPASARLKCLGALCSPGRSSWGLEVVYGFLAFEPIPR